MEKEACEARVRKLAKSDPLVMFLLQFTRPKIACRPCEDREAGFDPKTNTVALCYPCLEPGSVRHALAHNLVHAYDAATTTLDMSDCRQRACAEVRASALSSECGFVKEFARGHFAISRQMQACVRRRAVLSLAEGGRCPEPERSVDEVFSACFADTAPFDEIY